MFFLDKQIAIFLWTWKSWPLKERPGPSQGGQASRREVRPLIGRQAPYEEAGPLKGRPDHLQGGQAAQRNVRPQTGRLGL